jgi:hypothetical protein
MSKAIVLILVLLTACGPARARRSMVESRSLWTQELEVDSREGAVIRRAWELKEKLKRDYTEFIGPPAAFNEMLDLKFTIAVNEMMLEFPEYYDAVTQRWTRPDAGSPPDRRQLAAELKMLRQRNAVIEAQVARSMEAVEKEALEDGAKRADVYRIMVGVVLLSLAIPSWKHELLAVTPPYKYVHGRYVIYRNASELIIDSPSGRTAYCRTVGRKTLGDAVCN